jgi:hypothetical protein
MQLQEFWMGTHVTDPDGYHLPSRARRTCPEETVLADEAGQGQHGS